jgi:hypothetical protein
MSDTTTSRTPLFPDFTMVRVLDPEGKVVATGAYVHMCDRVACLDGDNTAENYHHCVLRKEMTDWGFPERIVMSEVTPPHTLEEVH